MDLTYAHAEYLIAAAVLVTAMLGMGAAHTTGDFLLVARAPHAIALVMAIQMIIGPTIALLVYQLFNLPDAVLIGMLLIAAMPGGSYSNLLTYFARGNVPLSVAATAVCTVASLLTTPLVLRLFGGSWFTGAIDMPVQRIVLEIAGWLLTPLILGMFIRVKWPQSAKYVERLCIRLSVALLIGLIVISLGGGHVQWHIGWRSHVAVILLPIIWLWTCYGAAILFRYSLSDAITMAIEVVVRNGGLALLLTTSLFPASEPRASDVGPIVFYVVLLYSAISFIVALTEVIARRRGVGLIHGRKSR